MKAHEETWEYQRDSVVVWRDGSCFEILDTDHDGELNPPDLADARGKLAAAAPEMARMLLELHDGSECCDRVYGPAPEGPYTFGGTTWKHAPDCRLVATLQKAGVLT